MGGAPIIENVRGGVQLAPDAAASFRRFERRLGREADVNRTYADYTTQLLMYLAWQAWVAGRGPRPNHSRALHPDHSMHCRGLAWDTDDWKTPGFLTLAAEYGWIQILPDDPSERHHLEYQWWRDQRRNDPAPAGEQEDDMPVEDIHVPFRKTGGQAVKAGKSANLHINDAGHVAVARDGGQIAGDLKYRVSAADGSAYKGAVQVAALVRTWKNGKLVDETSLGVVEKVFTGGDTFGEYAVHCRLQEGQRLSFRIGGAGHDFKVITATFRGQKA